MIGFRNPTSDSRSTSSNAIQYLGQEPPYQSAQSTLEFVSLPQLEAGSSTQSPEAGSALCQTSQASLRNDKHLPAVLCHGEKIKKQSSSKTSIPPACLYNNFERQTQSSASDSPLGASKKSALTHSTSDDPLHLGESPETGEYSRSPLLGVVTNGHVSALHGPKIDCDCVRCLNIGGHWRPPYGNEAFQCRVSGCDFDFKFTRYLKHHEMSHFNAGDGFACQEHDCTFKTNRWAFLLRHYSSKHCQVSREHPCPEIGCERKGEKAFKRADKLKSHLDEVHRGKKRVRKAIPCK